jgi:uncharacterized glyoxalase superfamily protein PhnB
MFGFNERWRAGNHRAQLSFGEGAIAISERNNKSSDGLVNPIAVSLMVRVTDVEKHYEHTLKNGARIIQRPSGFPYGERQYSVEDIGGYIWTFSQSIADVAPEDWGGTTAIGNAN